MSRVLVDYHRTSESHAGPSIPDGLAAFPVACRAGERCPGCEGPDLTPRTALLLTTAGRKLAMDVRAAAAASCVPVPMHYLALALDDMSRALERGQRPVVRTLAEQLCLHVMIACATDLAFDVGDDLAGDLPRSVHDYDFERLYDTLLPDDAHETIIWHVQQDPRAHGCFDFYILCEVVPDAVLDRLFQEPVRHRTAVDPT